MTDRVKVNVYQSHTKKKTVSGVDRLVKHGITSADNRQTHIEPKYTLPSPGACQSEQNGKEITLFIATARLLSLSIFVQTLCVWLESVC